MCIKHEVDSSLMVTGEKRCQMPEEYLVGLYEERYEEFLPVSQEY